MARTFDVAEANAALPRLQALVAELMATHQRIVAARPQVERVVANDVLDGGNAAASRMTMDFARLEAGLRRINAMGVSVKDIGSGLCDFPALFQGRDILLCWRYGEPRVEWWHELHSGFPGRRHVRELGPD